MGVWRYLIFCFLILVFLAAYIVQSTIQHEYIHQLIFDKYGIDSNVTYNFWNAARAQAEDAMRFDLFNNDIDNMTAWAWVTPIYTNTSGNCTETCRSLHTQQEIADSQTANIVMILFVILFIYVTYREFLSKKTEVEIVDAPETLEEEDIPESRFHFELSK